MPVSVTLPEHPLFSGNLAKRVTAMRLCRDEGEQLFDRLAEITTAYDDSWNAVAVTANRAIDKLKHMSATRQEQLLSEYEALSKMIAEDYKRHAGGR